MKRRDVILNTVSDLVADLVFYDRKEDEELGPDEINVAVDAGEITIDDMVSRFRDELTKGLTK